MKKILMIMLVVCFMASPVLAEDAPQSNLKSHSTARVLSLIPINSPAIFYVNRPVRGAIYSFLEAGGLTEVAFGAYFLTQVGNYPSSIFSGLGDSIVRTLGVTMIVVGSAAWAAPWIHTIVATPSYVDDCNQKIKEKTGIVSFYPVINSDGKGNLYGVGLNYRFP